jgi:hypothetical protein
MPGDNDSDPNDWSGTPWVVAAIFAFLVLVSIITYLLFRGGRLTWRGQRTRQSHKPPRPPAR